MAKKRLGRRNKKKKPHKPRIVTAKLAAGVEPSAQKEAEELQYSLRSSFFYRRHREFSELIQKADKLDTSLEWGGSEHFGVSATSLKILEKKKIPLHLVFCHPKIIKENPRLIAYYRSLAAIPQKGVARLAFATAALEDGQSKALSEERAQEIATLVNSYISSIVDSDPHVSVEGLRTLGALNFGTQLNGSWRGEIGKEGTRKVKELLLVSLSEEGLTTQVTDKQGEALAISGEFEIDDVKVITVHNGYKLVFGSEPDVSLLNPESVLEGCIEVKAGIDPAGALERYGAAKKSFDSALSQNKAAITVYLASCLTDRVVEEMGKDRLVRKHFDLTSILVDPKAKEEFASYIRWVLHL